jgi:uncharacterized protein (UPF0332 family)
MSVPDEEVRLYIEHAREMLNAAAYNISGGFHGSAVNRAYYAIFYAANALLATQGLRAVDIRASSPPSARVL